MKHKTNNSFAKYFAGIKIVLIQKIYFRRVDGVIYVSRGKDLLIYIDYLIYAAGNSSFARNPFCGDFSK